MNAQELYKAVASLQRRQWCPWQPHPRQRMFLESPAKEALFGGAAMGGKTIALLMGALQYVDQPQYSAIIFRRTFADLNEVGSSMQLAQEWLGGTDAKWNGQDHRWTFPSGAMLSFGYLDTNEDRFRYKSARFHYIGFDELTTMTELCYRYLFTRCRKNKGDTIPLRIRSATNPGDRGHEWVKKRFINQPMDPPPKRPGSRVFIPSKIEDNPTADADEYREMLAEVDEVTRRQLEDGIWEQDAEGKLYRVPESALIDFIPEGQWQFIRSLDFGVKDRNSITILGWRKHDPTTYVLSSRYFQGGPYALAEELKKDPRDFVRTVGDLGGAGKPFQEDIQLHAKIPIEMADKPKHQKAGHARLINDEYRRGTMKIYRPACLDLIAEYGELLRDDKGNEVDGQDNHCADATLYGWRACPSFMEREKAPDVEAGTKEWEQAEIAKVERELRREARAGRRHGGWLRQMGAR